MCHVFVTFLEVGLQQNAIPIGGLNQGMAMFFMIVRGARIAGNLIWATALAERAAVASKFRSRPEADFTGV